MGFGIIAGVIAFANVLRSSGGPGVVGVTSTGGSPFFILSSGIVTYARFITPSYSTCYSVNSVPGCVLFRTLLKRVVIKSLIYMHTRFLLPSY